MRLYHEITNSEYYDYLNTSDYERLIITNGDVVVLNRLQLNYRIIGDMFEINTTPKINAYKIIDDYFIARCYSLPISRYFKCDQIDGLIQCLEYLSITYI